ncbi:hypothetical protein [Streptomyces sp. NPDC101150]|uniref:hypothetical protein n=1 Tax=Streptomyces sp. NPDC101150 TaxID=3366114 RepID=UPI0038298227
MRSVPAEPTLALIDITAFPDQHNATCADVVGVPLPLGPLVTEMIALHTHTRHLSWLSERENCPDEYRLLARSIVHQVLAGWHHQTGGRGTIEDLLTDTACPARIAAQDDHPSDSGPVCCIPDLGARELAESAPQQGAAPWWSHARGQR